MADTIGSTLIKQPSLTDPNTLSWQLGYNADDDITGITDRLVPTNSQLLSYDSLNRLIGTSSFGIGGSNISYGYDANGNRNTQTLNGTHTTFNIATTSNQLLSLSGGLNVNYSYDADGNITGDGTHSYTYDDTNRLTQVDSGSTATYLYNALGQRVEKTAGSSTVFVYDEAGHVLGEYTTSGIALASYLWLNDTPVGVVKAATLYFIQTDQLGTPRAITNASQQVVWQWRSDPFGTSSPTGSLTYNLRFSGQYYDAETGRNYNYFRDYDPKIGRYIESDPVGLAGGLNTYTYVSDSPVGKSDLYGLLVLLCSRKLGNPSEPALPGDSYWPLRHEYLVVNGQSFSFQPTGDPLLSPGSVLHNEKANSQCTTLCNDPNFDSAVLSAISTIGTPTYCLLAIHGSAYADVGLRNCQTWTEDVLNLAKQTYTERYGKGNKCQKCFAKQ